MLANSAASDYNDGFNASGGAAAESGASSWLETASTDWGQGDGLNGDVLRPESLDELTDILDRVEIEASIDSESYIRRSELESKIYGFDEDGNNLFTRNSWGNAQAGENYSGGSIINSAYLTDSEDIITASETYSSTFVDSADIYSASEQSFEASAGYSTDVEYSEGFKSDYNTRELFKQISNSNTPVPYGTTGQEVDQNNGLNDQDSTYLFIRPESIRNESIFNGNYNHAQREYNPHPNDFDSLSQSAPVAIEISRELVSEIQEAVSDSHIGFDSNQIQSFTTDSGNSGDLTIQLSNYIDEDGRFDIVALNRDQRFILEVSNEVSQKLVGTDRAYTYINLRSDPTPNQNSNYINLYAFDHEGDPFEPTWNTAIWGDKDPRDYVEDAGEGNSTIELFLNPIRDIPDAIIDGLSTEVKYNLENVHVNFDTLAGHSSGSIHFQQPHQQLTNSIQSITLDFNGLDLANLIQPLEISIAPNTELIDLANLNDELEIIDFGISQLDWGYFSAEYSLYANDSDQGQGIGNITLNGDYDYGDGELETRIRGNIWNEINMDNNDISTRLTKLGVRVDTFTEHGGLDIYFDHDPNSTVSINNIQGWGWGEQYSTNNDGTTTDSDVLPQSIQMNWEQFAALEFTNLKHGLLDPYNTFIDMETYLDNGFRGDEALAFTYALSNAYDNQVLSQNAVLGDSVDHYSTYNLDIFAESLADDFRLEATDFTINFNPLLFENISASDIRIDGVMPVANAVSVDNEAGTIRIAAASLSDITRDDNTYLGNGITSSTDDESGKQKLATISLDFSESKIMDLAKNQDGSLMVSPLYFNIEANLDETTFSQDFYGDDGQLNREILSLNDLGGGVAVDGQEVTLYEAKINFEQLKDGLVLGTQRVIGADSSFTNLIRKGDILTTTSDWLNVGNIQANDLNYSALYNQNASLENAYFSQTSVASGSFIDGVFVKDSRESTTLTTDIRITGDAGNVVDLSDGIVSIQAEGSEIFSNKGKGSSNLITFQGDLNYDGRVSMKDLAYLNAGAARQQLVTTIDQYGSTVEVASEASYARDVDADFSGKIDLADLSVLDADWGKTLHNGDEQFHGSSDVSWSELDEQGDHSSWDNDSFKDQNQTEAEAGYVGSLESPAASNVIGADGNTSANDGDSTATYFQETI
tara:strand:- start:322 stop:3792 length:3471 start_codon:yes stop_codon:yes gene_type:complete